MLQNQQSNLQRNKILKHPNQIKKPDAYGTTFESVSPWHISLKPTDLITIDTRIEVLLPDEIIEIPLPMPTTETLKLWTYKLNC